MTDCFDIAFFVLGALEVIITRRNVFTLVLAQTLYCIMYFCSMHIHAHIKTKVLFICMNTLHANFNKVRDLFSSIAHVSNQAHTPN